MSKLTIADLDALIAKLSECKPLSEQEVKELCEKVLYYLTRYGKIIFY
jgi:hypothetical protein